MALSKRLQKPVWEEKKTFGFLWWSRVVLHTCY